MTSPEQRHHRIGLLLVAGAALAWSSAGIFVRLIGADLFTMLCRNRWAGLEQEGFGIVFLEAAAAGVAQVAGESGGSAEAVVDGETGLVVGHPDDVDAVTAALAALLDDPDRRARMGVAARARAEAEFAYEVLVDRLAGALP